MCIGAAVFAFTILFSVLVCVIYPHKMEIDRNSPYPIFKSVHVRNGFINVDMRDLDVFWTHRNSTIYLTKKGTYILFTTGGYGDSYEAISKDRAKQYVIQTTGIKNAVKLFPEIEEEMASFKNEI